MCYNFFLPSSEKKMLIWNRWTRSSLVAIDSLSKEKSLNFYSVSNQILTHFSFTKAIFRQSLRSWWCWKIFRNGRIQRLYLDDQADCSNYDRSINQFAPSIGKIGLKIWSYLIVYGYFQLLLKNRLALVGDDKLDQLNELLNDFDFEPSIKEFIGIPLMVLEKTWK